MSRLLACALLVALLFAPAAALAVECVLTMNNVDGVGWTCQPAGEADIFAMTSRFTALTAAADDHLLTPIDGNRPPEAAFTASSDGLTLSVDASDSADADGDALIAFAWDWGDGSSDPATALATAAHSYTTNGVYTITLTVTDARGASDTFSRQVAVSDGTGTTGAVKYVR